MPWTVLLFLKRVPKNLGKKVSEKWNVRDNKANFVKLFSIILFFVFSFCIILFKLRESLGLCILSKKPFPKLDLLFNFLKLEFPEAPERWVGHGGANILWSLNWRRSLYKPTWIYGHFLFLQLQIYLGGHKKKKH